MEKVLRQLMQKLGSLVEKIIDAFHRAKMSKRLSVSNPKNTENTLSKIKIQKILELVEIEGASTLVSNLSNKKVLHVSVTGSEKWAFLLEKGAQKIVDFEVGISTRSKSIVENSKEVLFVHGDLIQSPFSDKSFDFSLLFAARLGKKDLIAWFAEIARVLQDGSRIILCFTHPYLEYFLNPREGFTTRIDHYYMALRKAGMYVEQIKETFIDPSILSLVKPPVSREELGSLEKIPFVIFFKAIRLRR